MASQVRVGTGHADPRPGSNGSHSASTPFAHRGARRPGVTSDEIAAILHKRRHVKAPDAVPLLQQGVKHEKVARASVPDVAERPVPPLFHAPIGDRHRDLDVDGDRPPLNGDALRLGEAVVEVGEACRGSVVVAGVGHAAVGRIDVPDLVVRPDVLVDDPPDDLLVVSGVLRLVDGEVFEVVIDKKRLDLFLHLLGRPYRAVAALVEVM